MLKQYKKLEGKIHGRIYYIMELLHNSEFESLDLNYLSDATIQSFSLEEDLITVEMYWQDSYDDYDWNRSYTFPIEFIEDGELPDLVILSYFKEYEKKEVAEELEKMVREVVHTTTFHKDLVKDVLEKLGEVDSKHFNYTEREEIVKAVLPLVKGYE